MRLALTLLLLLGIPVGVGAFTFVYAKGFSYLSTDPRACVNCHVMNEQYEAWLKSGHRHAATCVECHLPHEGLAKWIAKADHGFRHSRHSRSKTSRSPSRSRRAIGRWCRTTAYAVTRRSCTPSSATADAARELDCMHCHAGAGHGAGG